MMRQQPANSSDLSLTGLVGSETLTLAGSGTLTTSAVGTGKTITLNTLAIANSTGLASNYQLSGNFNYGCYHESRNNQWITSL